MKYKIGDLLTPTIHANGFTPGFKYVVKDIDPAGRYVLSDNYGTGVSVSQELIEREFELYQHFPTINLNDTNENDMGQKTIFVSGRCINEIVNALIHSRIKHFEIRPDGGGFKISIKNSDTIF